MTIGLEIHAELKTQTKMFCACKNDSDEKAPNTNICPVCMGHPGTLPVINRGAVKSVLQVGLAIGGQLADYSEFDRKNYFYPDLPKGYQISQYAYPLVSGGKLGGVEITRVHLEEDTARSSHAAGGDTLVDFNRGGVPLMELVTEPAIHDAATAGNFARELQLLLRTLEVSNASMEKGEMRVEVNISVSKTDQLGTKVEVKNLNSFKSAEKAIVYEASRQAEILEKGERVPQETRGWDENKQVTFSQRVKEVAADYRYFPDPDLPKLRISDFSGFDIENIRAEIPELPWEYRTRLESTFGLSKDVSNWYTLNKQFGCLFELALQKTKDASPQMVSNLIINNLVSSGPLDRVLSIDPSTVAGVADLLAVGEVSSNNAVVLLQAAVENIGSGLFDAKAYAVANNLLQQSDESSLRIIAQKVVAAHAGVVSEYNAGKEKAFAFLIGQCMKQSGGSANPQVLRELLLAEIAQ